MLTPFDHFQIAALLTLAGLFIGRAVHARRVRRVPPITFKLKDRRNILTVSFFIAMTGWFILALVDSLYPGGLPPALRIELFAALGARVGGLVITLLGLALYVIAIFSLGESWRVGDPRGKGSRLVTQGVYSLSRNPIYLSFILIFAGIFLLKGALVFLIFAVLLTLNIHYLIIEEEAWLLVRYGAAFRAYRAATGRYLTGHHGARTVE